MTSTGNTLHTIHSTANTGLVIAVVAGLAFAGVEGYQLYESFDASCVGHAILNGDAGALGHCIAKLPKALTTPPPSQIVLGNMQLTEQHGIQGSATTIVLGDGGAHIGGPKSQSKIDYTGPWVSLHNSSRWNPFGVDDTYYFNRGSKGAASVENEICAITGTIGKPKTPVDPSTPDLAPTDPGVAKPTITYTMSVTNGEVSATATAALLPCYVRIDQRDKENDRLFSLSTDGTPMDTDVENTFRWVVQRAIVADGYKEINVQRQLGLDDPVHGKENTDRVKQIIIQSIVGSMIAQHPDQRRAIADAETAGRIQVIIPPPSYMQPQLDKLYDATMADIAKTKHTLNGKKMKAPKMGSFEKV